MMALQELLQEAQADLDANPSQSAPSGEYEEYNVHHLCCKARVEAFEEAIEATKDITSLFNEAKTRELTLKNTEIFSDRLRKTQEELGELTQEYLKAGGSILASKSAQGTPLSQLEEACDVLNCAMSLVFDIQAKYNIDDSVIATMYDTKLKKVGIKTWQNLKSKPKQLIGGMINK